MRHRQLRVTAKAFSLLLLFTCYLVSRTAWGQDLPETPQAAEMGQIIRQSMVAFSDAVNLKRFDKFRDGQTCSNEFLKETTAKQMGEQFKPFIDNNINLSAVKDAEIVVDGAPVLTEGVLRVAGHFQTQPMNVLFDFAFLYEGGWRVYGMTVGLRKSAGADAPVVPQSAHPGDAASIGDTGAARGKPMSGANSAKAPAEQLISIDNKIRALITGTMLDFNTALQRKDFTQFISKASPAMQKQVKPAQLIDAYAQFIKENVDFSDVGKSEPHFNESPSIKSGVILNLKGYYQITPLPVLFDVEYFKVSGEWKLLSLSVQTISPGDLKDSLKGGSATPEDGVKPSSKTPKSDAAAEGEKSDTDKPDADMKKDEEMKK